MDQVYNYIFTNIYKKSSSIIFIEMNIEDLNKSEDFLNKYFKQSNISSKNKIYKICVPYIIENLIF